MASAGRRIWLLPGQEQHSRAALLLAGEGITRRDVADYLQS